MVYGNGKSTIRLRTTEGFQVVVVSSKFFFRFLFLTPSAPATSGFPILYFGACHRRRTWLAENNAAHSFLGRFHLFLDEWIPTMQDYNFGPIFDAVSSPKTKIEMANFICRQRNGELVFYLKFPFYGACVPTNKIPVCISEHKRMRRWRRMRGY